MTELEQVWSQMLAEAGERAYEEGRQHVADYLRLRATNDAIRARAVTWLIDAFIQVAIDRQRNNSHITIERSEPYEFAHGNSTMLGTQLLVRHGVRRLTVEAGWARLPSHGIMPKAALAVATITHFGLPDAGAKIHLTHHRDELPRWMDDRHNVTDMAVIKGHFDVLLGS